MLRAGTGDNCHVGCSDGADVQHHRHTSAILCHFSTFCHSLSLSHSRGSGNLSSAFRGIESRARKQRPDESTAPLRLAFFPIESDPVQYLRQRVVRGQVDFPANAGWDAWVDKGAQLRIVVAHDAHVDFEELRRGSVGITVAIQ